MSLIKLYKDQRTIEIPESALTRKPNNEFLDGSFCPILEIDGLQWWVICNPGGDCVENAGFVSVYVAVSKPIEMSYTLSIKDSDIKRVHDFKRVRPNKLPRMADNTYQFDDRDTFNWNQLVSHKFLLSSGGIVNGKFTLVCDVEFAIPIGAPPAAPKAPHLFVVNEKKVSLVMTDGTYRINKAFLMNISPMFNAMVNTRALIDTIEILDFNLDTVSKTFNYCLGLDLGKVSIKGFIDVLRFSLKYEIKGLVKHIEAWLKENITIDTVSEVAEYAWKFDRKDLQLECARCFYKNRNDLTINPQFVNMDPAIIQSLLKTTLLIKP